MAQKTPYSLVIVDDHELLSTTLALALRLAGLDATTISGPSVEAVVAAVRARAPVVVLLDLDLGPPLGSGLDLIVPLIAAGGRIVMMTAVEDQARLGACLEVGAVGIVSKKGGFDDLVDAVRRAVEGKEVIASHYRELLLNDLRDQRQALLGQIGEASGESDPKFAAFQDHQLR